MPLAVHLVRHCLTLGIESGLRETWACSSRHSPRVPARPAASARVGLCAPLVPIIVAPRMPRFSHLVQEAEAVDHVGFVVVAHARVTIGVERQTARDSLLLCQFRRERVRCDRSSSLYRGMQQESVSGRRLAYMAIDF